MKKNIYWIAVAGFITFIFVTLFLVIQQTLRYAANEPQQSMSQAVAARLKDGADPKTLLQGHVDINDDMSPFIIIYNQFGKVVAGNGYLDGKNPQVPIGVLTAAKDNKLNSVTWQPDDKTRIAAVSAQGDKYYVLGGRNLKVIENKTRSIMLWLIILWLFSLSLLAGAYRLIHKKHLPRRSDLEDKS